MIRGLVRATKAPTLDRVTDAVRTTGRSVASKARSRPRSFLTLTLWTDSFPCSGQVKLPLFSPLLSVVSVSTVNPETTPEAAKGISSRRYRQIVGVAGVFLVLIVLSGAAVRLTQSGLGCEDWPKCSEGQLVPEWAFHSWIEFGNRLISGVIGIIVIAAALGAYRRVPRRRDLYPWAWGLVAGVLAQVVLGGMTVWVDLHPLFVSVHFLLSIVLIWNVMVLWRKAALETDPETHSVSQQALHLEYPLRTLHLSRAVMVVATVVLVIGTLVTGTGPNSGDSQAVRLAFDLRTIAQVHSATAWVLVALIVALAMQLRPRGTATRSGGAHQGSKTPFAQVQILLALTVAQGALGYVQYALGVPAALVELHVAGSLAVWCVALWLHLTLGGQTSLEITLTSPTSGIVSDSGLTPGSIS